MLLMMVSLIAVCQYPMIKKFNGTDVVIMTTKQAEGINTKFLNMKDSITNLTNTLNGCTTSLYFTQDKLETTLDSLSKVDHNLKTTTSQYNFYKNEYDDLKQDYIKRNREYHRNTTGLLTAVGLFTVIITILAGKF